MRTAYHLRTTIANHALPSRLFLAEASLILCKVFWKFDMQLDDQMDWEWPKQRAWLAYELNPLMVKLQDRVFRKREGGVWFGLMG